LNTVIASMLPALEMLRVNGLRQTLQAFALRLSPVLIF